MRPLFYDARALLAVFGISVLGCYFGPLLGYMLLQPGFGTGDAMAARKRVFNHSDPIAGCPNSVIGSLRDIVCQGAGATSRPADQGDTAHSNESAELPYQTVFIRSSPAARQVC